MTSSRDEAPGKSDVVFVWHMHQPYYGWETRDPFLLPWVRLHAVKAYTDMAWMLERHPTVHAVVNFSGVLLRQLREYVEDGRRDAWWDLTLRPADELTGEEKLFLLQQFFNLNWRRRVRPVARFAELLDRRGKSPRDAVPSRFGAGDMRDLQVLFNLQWCGFAMRAESGVVSRLVRRGRDFSEEDKRELLAEQIRWMERLPDAWRALADRGQVELTTTPMFHPILPLLIDSDCAREALPDAPLPRRFRAPEDATSQVRLAIDEFRSFFGRTPSGLWPAEGSVSQAAAELLAGEGVRWIATDEMVLARSDRDSGRDHFTPWRLQTRKGELAAFFRDHALSDLIGFTYSQNEANTAAADLVSRIGAAGARAGAGACVTLVVDGENPWEAYEDDGRLFLDALYRDLSESGAVRTALPRTVLARGAALPVIRRLHSGSWIGGNFRIWIGKPEKNRGWDLLGAARDALVGAEESGACSPEQLARARASLWIAEGSDWFWWYGDDFESNNDEQFDLLFRRNCAAVYSALGLEVPPAVEEPIVPAEAPAAAVAAPVARVSPKIDGRVTSYYEWTGAAVIHPGGGAGSMWRSTRFLHAVHFGFDRSTLYVRVDFLPDADTDGGGAFDLALHLHQPNVRESVQVSVSRSAAGEARITCARRSGSEEAVSLDIAGARVAWRDCVELALPLAQVGLRAGRVFDFTIRVLRGELVLQRIPESGRVSVAVPGDNFTGQNWIV